MDVCVFFYNKITKSSWSLKTSTYHVNATINNWFLKVHLNWSQSYYLALTKWENGIGLASCSFQPFCSPVVDHLSYCAGIHSRVASIGFTLIPDSTKDWHLEEWMDHGIKKCACFISIATIAEVRKVKMTYLDYWLAGLTWLTGPQSLMCSGFKS